MCTQLLPKWRSLGSDLEPGNAWWVFWEMGDWSEVALGSLCPALCRPQPPAPGCSRLDQPSAVVRLAPSLCSSLSLHSQRRAACKDRSGVCVESSLSAALKKSKTQFSFISLFVTTRLNLLADYICQIERNGVTSRRKSHFKHMAE